jgi:tRNA (cmo5U34)-methyltransferase
MTSSTWQDETVARNFLERRDALPYHGQQLELMLRLVAHFRPEPRLIMDLGCGDGLLGCCLLTRYPAARAILLDHSPPMLERARAATGDFEGRCEIVLADLSEPLGAHAAPGSVDVIVSGYAIHHLPHERKRSLYTEVYALLAPGGLFVNLEHVASLTPAVEALWNALIVDRLAAHSGRPWEQVEAEYMNRPDRVDNILAPVETQVAWLREIGFAHADCYFKWLELAVFGGVKPDAGAHP